MNNLIVLIMPSKNLGLKLFSYLIFFILPLNAHAQLNVNLTPTATTASTNITAPANGVLFLKIKVYDADYTDEVTMNINGLGSITLFPSVDSGNNNMISDVVITLNTTQKAYFTQGINSLTFTLNTSDPKFDGVRIDDILVIDQIATKTYSTVNVQVDEPISDQRIKALEIYKRIAGISTPIDSPILIEMETQINRGNMLAAAKIAMTEPSFYNLVVRDFAARMSTREQTINENMNDFIATFIGTVRDNLDARLLLTGDYFYMASPATPVPSNLVNDLLKSNNHYLKLESGNYDYASVLERVGKQYLRTPGNNYVENPDASGVLTSRAFLAAHAIDGTNRRLVEYTFKQFTCSNMEEWADATSTDVRVGRDIDRFPGGEGTKYLTTCKACHSNMDGFRGAFAKYDFDDNFVKYGAFYPSGGGENAMDQSPSGIADKMNGNNKTFPTGYITTDDSWINNARSPANEQRFGWRGVASSGNGVKQMATAVANSKAFSRCMTTKVYQEICRRPVAKFETSMVESLAQAFESSGYNFQELFANMVIRPECLGAR
jgi:hypothetical protein